MKTVMIAVIALVVAMLNVVQVAGPASAADPDSVQTTLEGCRNNGGIVLPDGDGNFICADAAYTTGNLGKGWNELDLVPYRLTFKAGNSAPATQTFTMAYAVDNAKAGAIGYDFLSVATLNTSLSDASCTAAVSSGQKFMAPGLGGVDKTLYRELAVTQLKGSTCVYDFYARLALGSHLFPGSSLHANKALPTGPDTISTSGIGAADVSIPVNEILPQEISKTMAASQNSNHIWSVSKSPTPASLNFGDSCVTAKDGASLTVDITVTWTKAPASATGYTVTTNVYAKNPAARVITVEASDVIKTGTTVLDSITFPAKDVPANTDNYLLGTHTKDFTTEQVPGAPDFNDVATATYTDKVTGIPVPGTTTATASVANADIGTGTTTNDTATVTDTESITGDGLSFSVAAPSVGSFTGGYTAGTHTTGPVGWTYGPVNSSGSVIFVKTVYLDQPRIVTGSLTDTAKVDGTNSGTNSASASVAVSSSAQVALTINKTLSPASSDAVSFTFNTSGPGDYTNTSVLDFPAGDTARTTTLTGLAPGDYTVVEPALAPFPGDTKNADITLPTCSASVDFTNTFPPPKAQVRKVTVPTGSESGWKFTLTGTGIESPGLDVTTGGTSAEVFPFVLQTGDYTITETTQDGWDLTGVSGTPSGRITGDLSYEKCTFSVKQLADAGETFECVFTNTARGKILIDKVTNPVADPQSFDFTLKGGPSALDQSFALTDVADPHSSGAVKPGSGYSAAETVPAGWDKTSATCSDGSPVTDIAVSPGETVTCTFTNTKRGHIVIHKITDPSGSTAPFDFTLTGGASALDKSFTLHDGESDDTLVLPGDGYNAAETVPEGWDLSTAVCGDDSPITDIDVSAGETVHCYFTNTQRGLIVIDKVTVPARDSQEFDFTLTGGVSVLNDSFKLADATAPHSSGFVKPGSGYAAAETVPAGWDKTSATCNDGSPVTNIAVSPGETVVCTFTNTKRGHIIVDKVTVPSGSSQSFDFGLTGGPAGSTINDPFSLTDAATPHDSGAIKAGTYVAAETPVTGWDLTSATCDDGSPVTAIDLAAGETVTCTFTNTQRGKIKIDKVTVPSGASQLFDFAIKGGPSDLDDTATLADATTPYSSGWILPGSGYNAAETPVEGWDLTSAACDDSDSTVTNIDVSPGETVTCTFTNTQRGKILVDKVTDPAAYPQGFGFGLSGGPDTISQTFSLADTTAKHDSGLVKPGSYVVAEDTPLPTGWQLIGSTCSDGSPVTAVAVGAGETVTCTFTNKARGSVDLIKTLNGAAIPSASTFVFTFQLRQGASLVDPGTTLETEFANGTNGGTLSFATALIPGQTYQMCEIVMPGWSTSLGTFVPDSFQPPDGVVPDPAVDNSILCGNFTVTPGQTFTFTVDNTPPPGGRALTIGFWKNWASCSKSSGGQKPVLDQTLAMSQPTGIVMSAQAGGYPAFGATFYLVLHGTTATPNSAIDCASAVALLNKSTIDGKKKMASDPAFNLAAQLVAAELNYTAGAGRTPKATTAINQAVLLLGKYKFNGITYSPKLSSFDAATMNTLAKVLDDYNNNRP